MSEKTVAQKLGLKPGKTLAVLQQPDDIATLIGPLPSGAQLVTAHKPCALILMFAKDMAALAQGLPGCKRQLEPGGALWVAYIKGTSRKKTDINRDSIRDYVATIGLDTVSQIAIDEDWSALRLKIVWARRTASAKSSRRCAPPWLTGLQSTISFWGIH